MQDADVVIVATNHSEFEGPGTLAEIVRRAADDCLLVDPWNALGTRQVFLFAAESSARWARRPPAAPPRVRRRISRGI